MAVAAAAYCRMLTANAVRSTSGHFCVGKKFEYYIIVSLRSFLL